MKTNTPPAVPCGMVNEFRKINKECQLFIAILYPVHVEFVQLNLCNVLKLKVTMLYMYWTLLLALFLSTKGLPTVVPRLEGSSSSAAAAVSTEVPSTMETTATTTTAFDENMTLNITTELVPTFDAITCDTEYQVSCGNLAQCVLKEHMCDGRRDCFDGSDESPDICHNHRVDGYVDSKGRFLPPTVKCPETWFFCRDASRCIEPASACDGINDCDDGSDEESFCHYLNVERVLGAEQNEEANLDIIDSTNGTAINPDKTAPKTSKSKSQ